MSDSTYLTAEGAEKLKEELAYLKGPKREELAKRLRMAIEQGDLSENADYSSAKEDQAFIEGRILEIETMLANVKIIDNLEREHGVVNIGSTVTIQEDSYEPEEYMIVGSEEADPFDGKISFRSPIGSALYLKHEGDSVTADTPNGQIKFRIINIR